MLEFKIIFGIYKAYKAFYLLKGMNYQSDNRRHVLDCIQQDFHRSFDHVGDLEAL